MQASIDQLRQRCPRAASVVEEPGDGDEDVVVPIYGAPNELNALSNAAVQLSAACDQRHNIFILPLVSPLADCPVRP